MNKRNFVFLVAAIILMSVWVSTGIRGQIAPPPAASGITALANGYVGIGTSTPQAVLDINGQLDLLGVQGLAFPTVDSTAHATILIGSGAGTALPASAAYGATVIGYQALGAAGLTTAATGITAIGYQALNANTSGNNSTCIGYQACLQTTTTANTAVGWNALKTGNSNSSTAIGFQALQAASITNGTAIGNNACVTCSGTGDTSLGASAGRYISSGARNVAVGQNAMQGITGTRITGSDNTAIGDQALLLAQGAAASNTALGSGVGSTITTGTSNILIGMSTTCELGAVTNSNEFHLCGPTADMMTITGNGTVGTETVTVHGPTTITQTGSTGTLLVTNSNGTCTLTPITTTWSCSSDARLKKDITDSPWNWGWAHSFDVRDFTLKSNGARMTGVIAQEVQKNHPEMVETLKDGTLTVDAPNPWRLIKAIQELQNMVIALFAVNALLCAFVFWRTRTKTAPGAYLIGQP